MEVTLHIVIAPIIMSIVVKYCMVMWVMVLAGAIGYYLDDEERG